MTDREQRVRALLEHAPGCRSVYGLGATHPHLSAYREQCSCGRDERIRAALLASPPAATNEFTVRECRGHFHVCAGGEDMAIAGDPFVTREAAGRAACRLEAELRVPAAPPTLTEERVGEIELSTKVMFDRSGLLHRDWVAGYRAGVWGMSDAIQRELRVAAPPTRPDPEPRASHRWNIEDVLGGGVRLCRGLHARSEDCEWETFVPAATRPEQLPSDEAWHAFARIWDGDEAAARQPFAEARKERLVAEALEAAYAVDAKERATRPDLTAEDEDVRTLMVGLTVHRSKERNAVWVEGAAVAAHALERLRSRSTEGRTDA